MPYTAAQEAIAAPGAANRRGVWAAVQSERGVGLGRHGVQVGATDAGGRGGIGQHADQVPGAGIGGDGSDFAAIDCEFEDNFATLSGGAYRHLQALARRAKEALSAQDPVSLPLGEVIDGAATKPFGFMKFTPGPGVGGHCLPIDPSYLAWRVKQHLGHTFRFVELANDVNEHMPDYVHERVTAMLNAQRKPLNGSAVLLLGLAYKKATSDWRESPSVHVADRLAGYPIEIVPGITSLSACAAQTGTALAGRNDVLSVVPATLEQADLKTALERVDCAVVIKVGRHLEKVRRVLTELDLIGRAPLGGRQVGMSSAGVVPHGRFVSVPQGVGSGEQLLLRLAALASTVGA